MYCWCAVGPFVCLQKTLKIQNSSDIAVKFCWKSFANGHEEEHERARLMAEINRMDLLEEAALMAAVADGHFGSVEDEDMELAATGGWGGGDEMGTGTGDGDRGMTFEARAAKSSLVRKYRNLRVALENDPMLFVDDIFDITPCEGMVWAKSEIEVS